MKAILIILLLFGIMITDLNAVDLSNKSKDFFTKLSLGDYNSTYEMFDSTVVAVFSKDQFKKTWESIVASCGNLEEIYSVDIKRYDVYQICQVSMAFSSCKLIGLLTFNAEEMIAGLMFQPMNEGEYTSPDYVDKSKFIEKEIKFGKNGQLPGTLSVPIEEGSFPAVVLVHGSGPNDRDESIYQNKPFKDLAHALSSNKIAVLRYDKRTKVHPDQFSDDFTVYDEAIYDVIDAVKFVATQEKIDKNQIYVLGHSLGASVIPLIAKEDSTSAGYIVMASIARPLDSVVIDQYEYILSLDTNNTALKNKLDEIKQQVFYLRSDKFNENSVNDSLPLRLPAAYWRQLLKYDIPKEFTKIEKPMFIIQGGRDYQVTKADFEIIKNTVGEKPNIKFKLYPNLNHLFFAGEGKSIPNEYSIPGNIDKDVILDIISWINNR